MRSSEHWYQFQKCIKFGDWDRADNVLKAQTAKQAYKLGRNVRGFDDKVWDNAKMEVMWRGLNGKFSQNEYLQSFLLSTGDSRLAEASPFDR